MVVGKGEKNFSLYCKEAKTTDCEINIVDDEMRVKFWHKKLSYMNEKDMNILAKK